MIPLEKVDRETVTIDETRLIGRMVFDLADGGVANKWFPEVWQPHCSKETLAVLQQEVNTLLFEQLDKLSKIEALIDATRCSFEFGYQDETLFKAETQDFLYYLRLTPAHQANNLIWCYQK